MAKSRKHWEDSCKKLESILRSFDREETAPISLSPWSNEDDDPLSEKELLDPAI